MENDKHDWKKSFFNTLFSRKKVIQDSSDLNNIEVGAVSDVGRVRKNNEDNFYVNVGKYNKKSVRRCQIHYKENANDGKMVFAVFDGMGGEEYGEKASLCAAETLNKFVHKIRVTHTITDEKKTVDDYILASNTSMCTALRRKKALSGGTTCVMACIDNYILNAYYLGDSRMYIYRDGKLKMVTKDHTLAYQKYEANIFTKEEAQRSIDSHKLTHFIGIDSEKYGLHASSFIEIKICKGDKILLCSDGLTDMCDDDEIEHILSEKNLDDAQYLVNRALDNGGRDNVTCVVIKIL